MGQKSSLAPPAWSLHLLLPPCALAKSWLSALVREMGCGTSGSTFPATRGRARLLQCATSCIALHPLRFPWWAPAERLSLCSVSPFMCVGMKAGTRPPSPHPAQLTASAISCLQTQRLDWLAKAAKLRNCSQTSVCPAEGLRCAVTYLHHSWST